MSKLLRIKNFFCMIVFFEIYGSLNAQFDSSAFFTQMITGENSKSWYSRTGVIVDNRSDLRYSTLSFTLNGRTGSITKPGGRDLLSSFRNLRNWKVQKETDKYILEISSGEKYYI